MRFRFFFQVFLFFSPVLIMLSCRDRDRIVELEKERENEIGYMEFPAGLDWINTDKPVKMKDLKGRISILYFWTYSCMKCSDIPEELTEFSEKWKDVVTVIGIHSGKFPNEKDSTNVRTAVRREGISFPVVNDPNLVLWRAYGLNSWPAFILIGADGKLIGRNTGRNFREQFDSIFEDIVRESEKKGELKRNAVSLPVSVSAKTEPALLFPSSLHLAKDHKTLYISDTNHHRVIIFDLEKNEIQSVIGTGRRGSRNGKFSEAEFSHPSGLVLKDDMLYIADRKNRSIRRADLKKKEVSVILGGGKKTDEPAVRGSGTNAFIGSPSELLAADSRLFISVPEADIVYSMNLKEHWIERFASGTSEKPGKTNPIQTFSPSGISYLDKKIYISESESNSIRTADSSGKGKSAVIAGLGAHEPGDSDGTLKSAKFQFPTGLTSGKDRLYISDSFNQKIKVLDIKKNMVYSLSGTGRPGMKDGSLKEASFSEPAGIAGDDTVLYIADQNNHSVRKADLKTGKVSTLVIQEKKAEILKKEEIGSFKGEFTDWKEISVSPDLTALEFEIVLPEKYVWNRNASSSFVLHISGETVHSAEKKVSQAGKFSIPVDLKKEKEAVMELLAYISLGEKDRPALYIPFRIGFRQKLKVDPKVPKRTVITYTVKPEQI